MLQVLRRGSLLLALLGLTCLYLITARADVPSLPIDRITPAMRFARVQLTGTVERRPYTDRDQRGRIDYLSFLLADGSGRIRVVAYRDRAERVMAGPAPLRHRDRVTVTGVVRTQRDGAPRLLLERITKETPWSLPPSSPGP